MFKFGVAKNMIFDPQATMIHFRRNQEKYIFKNFLYLPSYSNDFIEVRLVFEKYKIVENVDCYCILGKK